MHCLEDGLIHPPNILNRKSMSNNNYHKIGNAPMFHVLLSTGMGTGFFPVAPGTAGALMALTIWYVLYLYIPIHLLTLVTSGLIVVTIEIGVWTSNVMEKYWGKDPRAVNIDEFVGTWIPLLVAPCGEKTWFLALLGFLMFRVIDIVKPLGCKVIDEKCEGGWGVMLDDILAGFYALILTLCVKVIMTYYF